MANTLKIESHIKRLQAQDFEQQPPGTILQDFETLINSIDTKGMELTKKSCFFRVKFLVALNSKLSRPFKPNSSKSQQKFYPYINGLYLLLRTSGLVVLDTLKHPTLHFEPEVYAAWRSLNATERYFGLLKAWWTRGDSKMISTRDDYFANNILGSIIYLLNKFNKNGIMTLNTAYDAYNFQADIGLYNLALLELFGILDIQIETFIKYEKGLFPKLVQITDWGQAILKSYHAVILKDINSLSEENYSIPEADPSSDPYLVLDYSRMKDMNAEETFDLWSKTVRSHIPAWSNDLKLPEISFQPGPHIFKVSLGSCWRRIAIKGKAFMQELASIILKSVNFESDHLYSFTFQDRFGRYTEVCHPYDDSSDLVVDEFRVGDIPLQVGMRIHLLFDYGANWEFNILVERVNAIDISIKKSQILEKHGTAPSQYGDDEDEYDEDDDMEL